MSYASYDWVNNRASDAPVTAGRTANIQESELSKVFFSARNLRFIQETIKDVVAQKLAFKYPNFKIPRIADQSWWHLEVIMRERYNTYADNRLTQQQLNELNNVVIYDAVRIILREMDGQLAYLRDSQRGLVPPSLEVSTSIKGTGQNQLRLDSYYNL